MLDVTIDGREATIDVREIIKDGAHPRFAIFDYVKEAPVHMIFHIHVPRRAKPLVDGLKEMGLDVTIQELGPSHFLVTAEK